MLIYSTSITTRLQYITDFAGNEITGKPFELTSDREHYLKNSTAKLNYSAERISADEFWIKPHTLLFEEKISEQQPRCFLENDQKAFFETEGDFPFDIFAASFYLLSRYEEYLPHKKDMYGRYAHENSLAFKEGFLNQPLVNLWLQKFKKTLEQRFPSFTTHQKAFTFLPTYDIDIAWSYKNKGGWRNLGGVMHAFLNGNWPQCYERIKVLMGKQKDPYDSYGWMNQLHEWYKLKPYYFFLLAERTGQYDKNISPRSKALRQLISDHLLRYPVGIHPSWRSGDDDFLLKKEIASLQAIIANKVMSSRQHYIRFTLPATFSQLFDSGIQFDFSMGYGSINGFRASVASPFYWYDLEKEKPTQLMLFPFCYMEANSFYEQKYSPGQALEEMRHYYKMVKNVNGTFIMIWHNHFLGTEKLYGGWREVYNQFIKEVSEDINQ